MNKAKTKVLIIIFLIICLFLGIIIFKILDNNTENGKNSSIVKMSNESEDYKVVSKYNPSTKNCEEIKVKIDDIFRGEKANNILEEYNRDSEFPINLQINDDQELIVVNYTINFGNFQIGANGVSKDIEAKVCESEEKGYIEYNDKIYMPIVQCINNFEYTKERKVDGSFVVLIPKDLHDYKIRIGANGQKVAYFSGK